MTAADDKRALRARMRALRAGLGVRDRVRKAAAVEARLFSLPAVAEAETILLFYSFGSEIDTARMAARTLEEGKRLLLPFLNDGAMDAAEVLPAGGLVPSAYGPKEPAHRVAVEPDAVDVVVAPGLAFDRRGHRLGYGGGHYDRYLRRLGAAALRTGIAFSEQVVEEVPAEPRDELLDVLVTDSEVIECRRGRDTIASDPSAV